MQQGLKDKENVGTHMLRVETSEPDSVTVDKEFSYMHPTEKFPHLR